MEDRNNGNGISRRNFMKCSAVLGGALLTTQLDWATDLMKRVEAGVLTPEEEYELIRAENTLYTVCLQCNTGCGIKVKLFRKNGSAVALKIDGNPYDPWNAVPHLPYKTLPFEVNTIDNAICPKGQTGIQTVYDPYRITKVLKRAGKRGEGKWMTVSFEQAIDEIVNGGNLFKQVKGEENRNVEGIKDICILRDPKIIKALSDDLGPIRRAKTAEERKMAVEEYKRKHAANLQYLIDPDHPDFGPKNNQLVYAWGRKKGGRSDFAGRFFGDTLGTTNRHGHTTVCQGSLYFSGKAMSEQYVDGTWKDGAKFYWQTEIEGAEFILFVGANLFDANYGPPNRSARLIPNIVSGKTKIAVADPRFSKLASKAWKYLPVNPGTDAALALAMIQWIIKDKRYNVSYLENANKAASKASGETTWTNAVWLVKIKDGKPDAFLRAQEIGLAPKETRKTKDGKEYEFEYMVVLKDGKLQKVDPNDEKEAVKGDLLVNTKLKTSDGKEIHVKSSLQILADSANEKTIEEWSKICGISVKDIEEVAREFTSHGRKASVDIHRGVSQHTNGFYNVISFYNLALLIGNYDYRGGLISASTYSPAGTKEEQPFNFGKLHPGKISNFGISIIRHDIKYEETTLFSGYPAKRNWWPLSSDIYQEIFPSMGDAYPYPIKICFLYMGAPNYSLPAGHTTNEILSDTTKIPLLITWDILVGPTSIYADYIFPDLSYLERWEFHGSHPNIPVKVQPVRNPVIAPIPETVTVFGEEMPISYEATMLAMAEKMKLPGYGKEGFGPGLDFTRPEDFYLKMVANIATDGKPVPDAEDKEVELFLRSRAHLPKSVFDLERWKKTCGEASWKKVIYVLNRGGRFQDYTDIFKGDQVVNKYGRQINMYQEKTAKTKNAFTGKSNPGYATYLPIQSSLGKPLEADGLTGDLHLLTQRDINQTKSRTITNYWLLAMYPENFIVMNKTDADRLKLRDGDRVKVVSTTNPDGVWDFKNGVKKPMIGKVKVTQTIKPGVVTFTLGHGHWATGASDVTIDGKLIKGDPRRGTGVHLNAAMWIDPYLKNTSLQDPVGGSVVFYDSKIRLIKV
jgi:anaerobic selenocysteine-containing dehydrogenase